MNDENARINAALIAPFPADDIEWRVQRTGKTARGPWVRCIPYVRVQAVQARLDEVFGPENWKNSFRWERFPGLEKHPPYIVISTISVFFEDRGWVSKEDGSEPSDFEPAKGGMSQAEKRTGGQWGIGRYLRKIDEAFGHVHGGGVFPVEIEGESLKWSPPELPAWALPAGEAPVTSTQQLRSQLEARKPEQPENVEPAARRQPRTWDGGGAAPVVDWGEVHVHFGKNKGKKLKDLLPASLKWYVEDWKPKIREGHTELSDTDRLLRDACDAAAREWADEATLDPPTEPATEQEDPF